VFKSNRDCRLLGLDSLRVYEYKDGIVFCCDTCSYCEGLSGTAIKLESGSSGMSIYDKSI
jgi:hypothetical protein